MWDIYHDKERHNVKRPLIILQKPITLVLWPRLLKVSQTDSQTSHIGAYFTTKWVSRQAMYEMQLEYS